MFAKVREFDHGWLVDQWFVVRYDWWDVLRGYHSGSPTAVRPSDPALCGSCPLVTPGGTTAAAPPPSGLATLPSVGAVP